MIGLTHNIVDIPQAVKKLDTGEVGSTTAKYVKRNFSRTGEPTIINNVVTVSLRAGISPFFISAQASRSPIDGFSDSSCGVSLQTIVYSNNGGTRFAECGLAYNGIAFSGILTTDRTEYEVFFYDNDKTLVTISGFIIYENPDYIP